MGAKICHDSGIISNIDKKVLFCADRFLAIFRKAIKLIVIVA